MDWALALQRSVFADRLRVDPVYIPEQAAGLGALVNLALGRAVWSGIHNDYTGV
jgi:hypothetical protein